MNFESVGQRMRALTEDELVAVSGGGTTYPGGGGGDEFMSVFEAFDITSQYSSWTDATHGLMYPPADQIWFDSTQQCPPGHTCIPISGTDGKYVRDTSDNKVYFSESGWQQYQGGANIDWGGVARDLAVIAGGSIAGAGGGISVVIGLGVGVLEGMTKIED